MTLHAHIETYAVDCDGPISRHYVMTPNDDENTDEQFGDLVFRDRVVNTIVNAYSLLDTGRLDVTRLEDGSVRLSWSETTDEGYRNAEATICEDDGCDLDDSGQRDYYAEAMGY